MGARVGVLSAAGVVGGMLSAGSVEGTVVAVASSSGIESSIDEITGRGTGTFTFFLREVVVTETLRFFAAGGVAEGVVEGEAASFPLGSIFGSVEEEAWAFFFCRRRETLALRLSRHGRGLACEVASWETQTPCQWWGRGRIP